jgi:hypothetical protein
MPNRTAPRNFGRPRISRDSLKFTLSTPAFRGGAFKPLPTPPGPPPFRLDLQDVIDHALHRAIVKKGRMAFHISGDIGGIKRPEVQQLVVDGMEKDFKHSPSDPTVNPVFFYTLGDCVYYNGETADYYDQFYKPYEHYLAPIFAVPGNHDGDNVAPETSLEAFVRNFCSPQPVHTPEAREIQRDAMTQPNVFWTLVTPVCTIVGLYTNVPEGGKVRQDQQDWLASELKKAAKSKALFVTMHHPVYSADDHHSGSAAMRTALNAAIATSGRHPDIVFAGHVHNYQRFTREVNGEQFPYIVAGAGGYWHLHAVAKVNGEKVVAPVAMKQSGDDVTLEHYVDTQHGFLRVEVDGKTVTGKYYVVPRPQESWSAPPKLVDHFQYNWRQHKLL